MVSFGFTRPGYLFCEITEYLLIVAKPSTTQSAGFFLSKRHSLQIQPGVPLVLVFTSPHSFFLAVTRNTSSPRCQSVTSPQHLVQSRCAYTGLVNHTRFLKRKVLSVKATTGQTSITLPIKSCLRFLAINVAIWE